MTPRHRVSRAAIELITRFEGYRRKAAQLPDGRWMIGYGHTLTAREGAEVSEEDAEALLLYDLIAVSHGVNEWAYAPLTQNQFDALCSFAFNIGLDNFRRSGVLRRLNEGALIQAACAMELWRRAEFEGERIVLDALVRRRAAEKALFLTPEGGWPTAPTPLLRPLLDADTSGLVPREPPASVAVSLEGQALRVERAPSTPVPPEEELASPVLAAAEAVASRLQTIFAEPAEPAAPAEPQAEPEPQVETAELEPEAMPAGEDSDTVAPEAPLFEDASPAEALAAEAPETPPEIDAASAEALVADDLVEAEPAPAPTAANDVAAPAPAAEAGPRVLIDDTAPYEFVPPVVQPLPQTSRGGPLSLVALAVIGLAFFGGGVFWALNARSSGGLIGPVTVGWLAGLAGVGLFSVAVFLILKRLGDR
jgi:lysozyme